MEVPKSQFKLGRKRKLVTEKSQGPYLKPPKLITKSMLSFKSRSPRVHALSVSFNSSDKSGSLSNLYDVSIHTSYISQCFVVENKIGEGSFGRVYKALSKEDGKYYAIKVTKQPYNCAADRSNKLAEVKKCEKIPKHENCVQFYRAWEENEQLYIQMQLCEKPLNIYVNENNITEYDIWRILFDMLRALKNLHDNNLIHLDVKLENIMVGQDGFYKLADFGLVFDLKEDNPENAAEGDPKYLPSELLEGIFTKAADIFSLGVVILELASDIDIPSGGPDWHNLRAGKFPPYLSKYISKDLYNVILRMMKKDYNERPTVDELLNLPYFFKLKINTRISRTFAIMKQHFTSIWLYLQQNLFRIMALIRRNPSVVPSLPSTPPRTNFTLEPLANSTPTNSDVCYSGIEVSFNQTSEVEDSSAEQQKRLKKVCRKLIDSF